MTRETLSAAGGGWAVLNPIVATLNQTHHLTAAALRFFVAQRPFRGPRQLQLKPLAFVVASAL